MARSFKHKMTPKKAIISDIDITSLLDIITILLVFLVMSYNPSGVEFNIDKTLELPKSIANDYVHTGIVLQVAKNAIWVDNKKIIDMSESEMKVDENGRRIISLYNELINKKSLSNQVIQMAPTSEKISNSETKKGMINIIADKTIKYSLIKKILFTCAEAGFGKYKLLVQNTQQ